MPYVLIYLLQFFAGVGVVLVVPANMDRAAQWASRRWELRIKIWHINTAECALFVVLAGLAYMFLPDGGELPLAAAIIIASAILAAMFAQAGFREDRAARQLESNR